MSKKSDDLNTMYIPLGLCFGMMFGMMLDNLALGICFGLIGGVVLDNITRSNKKK